MTHFRTTSTKYAHDCSVRTGQHGAAMEMDSCQDSHPIHVFYLFVD